MNDQQHAFLVQAKSDYDVLGALRDEAACHQLHYLQMCTEKLGKAFFKRQTTAKVDGSHAFFVKFLRAVSTNRSVREGFGFSLAESFEGYVRVLLPLAYDLERLAPDLARDGPNTEYPFPRSHPTIAPAEHDFQIWDDLHSARGQRLLAVVRILLDRFEEWF